MEGSRYEGTYVVDTVNFIDELAKFEALKDKDIKLKKHSSIFGCANLETNIFSQQEADGIMGLGLVTDSSFL